MTKLGDAYAEVQEATAKQRALAGIKAKPKGVFKEKDIKEFKDAVKDVKKEVDDAGKEVPKIDEK